MLRNFILFYYIIGIHLLAVSIINAQVLPIHSTIIKDFETDPSIVNVFSTPITFFGNSIFTVRVEPPQGESNQINLRTVISKGIIGPNGQWKWTSYTIENRTLEDKYHTQPSLIVDKKGYIHVAYNMHNMPWQYSISKKPEDISEFVFKGEFIDYDTLRKVKHENKK